VEIRSVASSGDISSTLVKDVDKGQNMDAFSELLAMLFSNMLIPGSNQYNLSMNQNSIADLNSTTENNDELTNMLSIIDNLRISGGQLKDPESIQNVVNGNGNTLLNNVLSNNTDFQKLLNLTDDMSYELKEFINNISNFNSTEAESLGTKLSNDSVEIIPEQLNKNITTSEIKAISDLMNIQTDENTSDSAVKGISDALIPQIDENTTISAAKGISDTLNTQTEENKTVSDPKKISDTFNVHTTAINADKSSIEALKAPNNSSKISYADNIKNIKSIIETNTDGKNNPANTQGEAKVINPEKKTITPLETANNFGQGTGLNNVKNENINMVTQQDKVPESALIEKPQDLIDITVEKFKTLKLPGSTEVTVKLNPKELGEVSLRLVLEKGQINGSITAERKEVVFMLQNNLEQLKTDLKNNNVNLNNITVNIQAGDDFNSNNRRGFNNKQTKNNNKIAQAFKEEIQSYDLLEGFNIIA
jgi:flagellar hook-length control protein FliK